MNKSPLSTVRLQSVCRQFLELTKGVFRLPEGHPVVQDGSPREFVVRALNLAVAVGDEKYEGADDQGLFIMVSCLRQMEGPQDEKLLLLTANALGVCEYVPEN
jgi:hypothetical protein